MGLLRRSTSSLFSAAPGAVPTRKSGRPAVDVAAAIGDRRPTTGLGGRRDADQDSGSIGGFRGGFFPARGRSRGADRAAGDAHRAGFPSRRAVHAVPGSTAADAASYLSALSGGTRRRLSAVFPWPERGAGMQRDLCAGIPAEWHGDRASHELRLASRLDDQAFLNAFARRRSAPRRSPAPKCHRR